MNITKAQVKQKNTYDRKHEVDTINVGTEVLLENTAQKQRKGGKLESAWLGPYIVTRHVGKGLYELSRNGKIIKTKANIARLKVYRKRSLKEMQLPSDDEEADNQVYERDMSSGVKSDSTHEPVSVEEEAPLKKQKFECIRKDKEFHNYVVKFQAISKENLISILTPFISILERIKIGEVNFTIFIVE